MNTMLQIFVVISILATVKLEQNPNLYRSDYKYSATVGGWLKLHRVPATWAEAERRCYLEGAVLASPLNNQLLSAMKGQMSEILQGGVYTGIHATISKGDYFSVEGVPLTSIPIQWAPDEPDNFENNERCLMLLTNGTAADIHCDALYPYICFNKRKPNMFISGCGTTDANYKYENRTGSCYKFHHIDKTWPEAFKTCAAEGGYLTVINSETEAEVIKDLFKQNPDNAIPGKIPKHVAHIGFYDWGAHGEWRTIHGESLQAAGYDKFSKGQPDNATGGQFCGAIYRHGLFDDIWCEKSFSFICEINPFVTNDTTKIDPKN